VGNTSFVVENLAYLVVDKLVQVFNKDIALTSLAEGRVTLRPHDPAKSDELESLRQEPTTKELLPCAVLNQRIIKLLQGALALLKELV
jgi:hypothetical protein